MAGKALWMSPAGPPSVTMPPSTSRLVPRRLAHSHQLRRHSPTVLPTSSARTINIELLGRRIRSITLRLNREPQHRSRTRTHTTPTHTCKGRAHRRSTSTPILLHRGTTTSRRRRPVRSPARRRRSTGITCRKRGHRVQWEIPRSLNRLSRMAGHKGTVRISQPQHCHRT